MCDGHWESEVVFFASEVVKSRIINSCEVIFENLHLFDLSSESKLELANQIVSKDPASLASHF